MALIFSVIDCDRSQTQNTLNVYLVYLNTKWLVGQCCNSSYVVLQSSLDVNFVLLSELILKHQEWIKKLYLGQGRNEHGWWEFK